MPRPARRGTTEARVIESIIITVPPSTGVTSRLRRNSHLEIINWVAEVTSTRVINVAGPPSTTAEMQNGMGESRREHGQHRSGPDRPDASYLQQRGHANDNQRGEHHPHQVGIIPAGRLGNHDRSHQQSSGSDQAELKSVAKRSQQRRIFVRLVTGILRSLCRHLGCLPDPTARRQRGRNSTANFCAGSPHYSHRKKNHNLTCSAKPDTGESS